MTTHHRCRTVLDCVLLPAPKFGVRCLLPPPSAPSLCLSSPSPEPDRPLSDVLPFPFPSPSSLPLSFSPAFDSMVSLSDDCYAESLRPLTPLSVGESREGGSDYREDLDDSGSSEREGSDPDWHSGEDGDGPFLSAPELSVGQNEKPMKNSCGEPPQKRIRLQAPRGSNGYPAEMRAPTDSVVSSCSVPYCSEASHVDPANGCPSTPVTQCAILHKLRMYFGPYGFVCEKCGQMYPPAYLRHHITSKHPNDLDITGTGKQRSQLYDSIVTHLLAMHAVPENLRFFDLPKTLSDPIPGLPSVLSYQCLACPEPRWFIWKSFQGHYRERHKGLACPPKNTTRSRFIIRPYRLGNFEGVGGRHKLSDFVIVLPEDWTPTNSDTRPQKLAIPKERLLVPAGAPHLVTIGWSQYLWSLEGSETSLLMKLVEMPRQKEIETFLPKRAALESGILQLDALLVRYLQDANAFLDSCHPSVRNSITTGTKAHYRRLTNQTYLHYRLPMMKTLCMLLRAYYFSRLQNQSYRKRLGNFSIAWNAEQASATRSLYDYLVSGAGKNENFDARCMVLVHTLLVSFVHHEIHGTRKMECPTDQSLFLLSLRLSPQGALQFQTANQLTHDCATFQYWFFTITVHVSRLKAAEINEFCFFSDENRNISSEIDVPSTSNHSATNQGNDVAEEDGLGEEDVVAVFPAGVSDDETDDEAEIVGAEAEAEAEQESTGRSSVVNVLRIIYQEKDKWLRAIPGPDYFTPYDRFKLVWHSAAPTAFKESAQIGHGFQPDGTTIVIDAVGERHRINLMDIGNEARRIVLEAETLIRQCLPQESKEVFASFPDLSRLVDDLNDPASIFRQDGNSTLLEPAISAVKQSLLPVLSSEQEMLAWLEYNDHLLALFLVSIALTCGIPPRGFQFASLQFNRCPETGAGRGVFLIDGCLAIGKPAAKQSGRSRQEGCLWFLPPALASCLAFYLAALRPVVMEILTRLRKEVCRQDTYIFCRTIPKITGAHSWNGDEITRMVQHHTKALNITLSIALLRQLYTAFFRQYFPGLCNPGAEEDSLVDRQGQHRFYTGHRHYGQLIGNVPRSLEIDVTEARKLGAMSQLLQIVFELRPPNEHLKPLLEDSHFLPRTKHDRHALDTARLLILCEYDILSRGAGPLAAAKARKILLDRPYFKLPTRPGDDFGDAVLIRVLHAHLFGEGGPIQYDQTPPGGYPVADAARAVTLIIQAVEEWTTGNHQPVVWELDLKAVENFKRLQYHAERALGDAKERWPNEWYELCKAVHNHRPQNYKRDWRMDGLPI